MRGCGRVLGALGLLDELLQAQHPVVDGRLGGRWVELGPQGDQGKLGVLSPGLAELA